MIYLNVSYYLLNTFTKKINHLKTYEKLKIKPVTSFSTLLQICLVCG